MEAVQPYIDAVLPHVEAAKEAALPYMEAAAGATGDARLVPGTTWLLVSQVVEQRGE